MIFNLVFRNVYCDKDCTLAEYITDAFTQLNSCHCTRLHQ